MCHTHSAFQKNVLNFWFRWKLGEGQCFHPSCFKCHTCKKEITGSYVKDKQGFLCSNCIPTCGECKKPLNGTIIDVEGKRLHTFSSASSSLMLEELQLFRTWFYTCRRSELALSGSQKFCFARPLVSDAKVFVKVANVTLLMRIDFFTIETRVFVHVWHCFSANLRTGYTWVKSEKTQFDLLKWMYF